MSRVLLSQVPLPLLRAMLNVSYVEQLDKDNYEFTHKNGSTSHYRRKCGHWYYCSSITKRYRRIT